MANVRNFGVILGRLVADPMVFDNADGSKKVRFTVAARDNFKTQGEYKSQFIPVEAFIPAGKGLGVYEYTKKGSLVDLEYSVRTSVQEKDGEKRYFTNLLVQSVELLDAKKTETAEAAAPAEDAVEADVPFGM